jgi:hypothetical protein
MTAPLPAAVVERVARAMSPGAFLCVENHVWTAHKIQAVRRAEDALAEFLAIIEERVGPEWGISGKIALGTETAQMAGLKSLAELLEDRCDG